MNKPVKGLVVLVLGSDHTSGYNAELLIRAIINKE